MDQLWPVTAQWDARGALWLGGCRAQALAEVHGTPLYVFDEATLRAGARGYRDALAAHYPGTARAAYASKAYLCTAIAQLFAEEGLDLDVVSGGELHVALAAGFPPERIHFHGNNKSREELSQALAAGVGRIVVDNFHELEMLAALAASPRNTQYAPRIPVWLRLAPGVSAHTHHHIRTGQEDTKFGFSIASGGAEAAVVAALAAPGLALVGLHAHIGSQFYDAEAPAAAAERLVAFAAAMRDRHGFELAELSPGGGWGVPMTGADPAAPVARYVEVLCRAVVAACAAARLALPHLVLEPGRSLAARAGVALYRAGARKEIPGVRTYVSVDGGMADNIRPALYGAAYTARVAGDEGVRRGGEAEERKGQGKTPATHHAPRTTRHELVTIAGKFCESGDVLIRDIELPRLEAGDLLAVPMAGAYTLAMASNYNQAPRPAAVLVGDGRARLIQRRETYDDLCARDLPLTAATHTPRTALSSRRFAKYHALGNDYIVLDPADWPAAPAADQVRRICDRRRGVGADGVLWGPIPAREGAGAGELGHAGRRASALSRWGGRDRFALRLFNPDGGEFEISGNGLRIFARYLWDCGLPAGPGFTIDTPAGPAVAAVLDPTGSRIAMEMGRLSFRSDVIGLPGPAREVIEEEVEIAGRRLLITAVTIGNPHCVVFADDRAFEAVQDLAGLSRLALALGPELERLPIYPQRTNVQFARAAGRHTLEIAIWERGAGYTLASGTSGCAAAGTAIRTGRCESPVTVRMPGGEMLVEVAPDWSVRLTGTVEFVCRGKVDVVRSA